jgi:hypothetical protein
VRHVSRLGPEWPAVNDLPRRGPLRGNVPALT